MNEQQRETLARLAARRWRLALALTTTMLAVYFGFILLVAFDKPLMGTLILGGRVSIGIVLGAMVILTAPVLTAIYVRWANRVYDPAVHAIVHGAPPPEEPAALVPAEAAS